MTEKEDEVQVKVGRDARTGRFVSRQATEKRPSTTIVQTVKKRRKKAGPMKRVTLAPMP